MSPSMVRLLPLAIEDENLLTNFVEAYLKTRADCKFDRKDFDCLSNKFLSKLVIRAN